MTTCGNCKTQNVSIGHVRECYAVKYGQPTQPRIVESVEPVGVPTLSDAANRGEDVEGVYFKEAGYPEAGPDEGTYYKVVRGTNTGNWYAKEWYGEEWNYAGRQPMHFLTVLDKVTAEQASRFGLVTSRCVFCSKKLTDERSIEVGYGQICAGHNGLPWGTPVETGTDYQMRYQREFGRADNE